MIAAACHNICAAIGNNVWLDHECVLEIWHKNDSQVGRDAVLIAASRLSYARDEFSITICSHRNRYEFAKWNVPDEEPAEWREVAHHLNLPVLCSTSTVC